METSGKNKSAAEAAKDKLHNPDLGETKDFDDLSFNEERNTYEVDVKAEDTAYDHPLPYQTASDNGADADSDYDEANPFVADEYSDKNQGLEESLNEFGMHIDQGESVELSAEDELLARTPEDDRADLDDEGYPVNDTPEDTEH
ncbi:hypothetical protein ABDJ41_18655 [Pedobacter sp. ASV1-7]|uniref:hypothetical protein n=1 Tax=Pedobacter sp. ASV1-7 TaxID=3145237 RepID=UPI0032E8BBEB